MGQSLRLLPQLGGEEAGLDGVFVEGLFQAFGQQFQARRRRLEFVGDVRDEVAADLVDPLQLVGADGTGAVSLIQRLLPVFREGLGRPLLRFEAVAEAPGGVDVLVGRLLLQGGPDPAYVHVYGA